MIPKFRVWLPDIDQMLRVKALVFEKDKTRCVCGYSFDFYLEDENATIMQSTGLFDKNGKEIFEGDVVQFEDCYTETDFLYVNTGIVEWSQGSFTITNRDSVEMGDLLDGEFLDVTIIGNVYENPELLEVNHDTIR
jgi:hypothetical protein|nr:MAG TPA: YopX protein [Caudoviricetes sp.]